MDNVTLAQVIATKLLETNSFTHTVVRHFAWATLAPVRSKTTVSIVGEVLEAVVAEGYHFVKTRETGSFDRELGNRNETRD